MRIYRQSQRGIRKYHIGVCGCKKLPAILINCTSRAAFLSVIKTTFSLEIPEVDAWFGTMELPSLLQRLNADYKHELIGERILMTPPHYAYLKISEGCNRTCTFLRHSAHAWATRFPSPSKCWSKRLKKLAKKRCERIDAHRTRTYLFTVWIFIKKEKLSSLFVRALRSGRHRLDTTTLRLSEQIFRWRFLMRLAVLPKGL
jgi:hypothetical protein